MSDYLDRLDSYYEEGESYWDREARLNKFKEGSEKIKCNVYRYRYLENTGKIQITPIGVRDDEYYIKDNNKYFIGKYGDICCEIMELNKFYPNGDYYMVGNETSVVEEFKRQLIKKLETDIEYIKEAKVANNGR